MIQKISLLVLICLLAVSCKKTRFLKRIDGNWKISKIVYSGGSLSADSVVNNPSTTLFFESCKLKESRSLNNCVGRYGAPGDEVEFTYSPQDNNGMKLGIYTLPPPSSDVNNYKAIITHIIGTYEIIELTASSLKIKSICCTNWTAGTTTYRTRYIEATQ